MVTSRQLLLSSIILLVFVSCGRQGDWIVFRGEEGRGAAVSSIDPPLGLKWKLRLQYDERRLHAFNPPVVKDGIIYFGSADGNFYAMDIETGYMRWVFKTGAPINSVPYADRENVYFGSTDGNAYAVSLKEGTEVWSFQTEREVNSTFVRHKDSVAFISDGGAVFFVSPEGELLHSLPNPIWHYFTFQISDDMLYFAPGPPSRPHSFGVYDLKEQGYTWILDTSEFDATWYSFPALHKDYLLFSTCQYRGEYLEFNYYAYDKHDGSLIWHRSDFSRWSGAEPADMRVHFLQSLLLLDYLAPAVWKNTVIYSSGDSIVRAFDAVTGERLWETVFDYPTSSAPTIAGDKVYIGIQGDAGGEFGRSPRLAALSARTGKVEWEVKTEGSVLSAPVIAGKWIMFGTDLSYFYIFERIF